MTCVVTVTALTARYDVMVSAVTLVTGCIAYSDIETRQMKCKLDKPVVDCAGAARFHTPVSVISLQCRRVYSGGVTGLHGTLFLDIYQHLPVSEVTPLQMFSA